MNPHKCKLLSYFNADFEIENSNSCHLFFFVPMNLQSFARPIPIYTIGVAAQLSTVIVITSGSGRDFTTPSRSPSSPLSLHYARRFSAKVLSHCYLHENLERNTLMTPLNGHYH